MCGVLFIFMQKTRIVNSGDPCDKLTLISKEVVPDRHGRIRTYWNCKCVCGNTIRKREDALFNRKHQSCGCDTSRLQASNAHRIKWKGTGQLGKTFFTACRKNAKKRDIEFGITIEEAWDQFEKQNGLCAVCKINVATDIDHSHETEQVRGLLCGSCNRALGLLQENREILQSAMDYLTLWNGNFCDGIKNDNRK